MRGGWKVEVGRWKSEDGRQKLEVGRFSYTEASENEQLAVGKMQYKFNSTRLKF